MFSSSHSKEPVQRQSGALRVHQTDTRDDIREPEDEPPHPACDYAGCTLEALWRQYDPPDLRYPRNICTHHRSYMLMRNPDAVLLYGWIGLFRRGRLR